MTTTEWGSFQSAANNTEWRCFPEWACLPIEERHCCSALSLSPTRTWPIPVALYHFERSIEADCRLNIEFIVQQTGARPSGRPTKTSPCERR